MTRLRVLCPQTYDGMDMQVVSCDRCGVGWNKATRSCDVYIGTEGMATSSMTPTCPLQELCQHSIQSLPKVCDVRRAGLVCESALIWAGVANAPDHPLSFHAYMMGE